MDLVFPQLTRLCLQVNFVAAIDVYEDGEAGLLLCYNCESPSASDVI